MINDEIEGASESNDDCDDTEKDSFTDEGIDIAVHDQAKKINKEKTETVAEARRRWAMIRFFVLRPTYTLSVLLYLTNLTFSGHYDGGGVLSFQAGVIDPIKNLNALIQMESTSYSECVQQSMNRTVTRINAITEESKVTMEKLFISNREIIMRAQKTANTCLRNTKKARESLIQGREDGMDIPWSNIIAEQNHQNSTTLRSGHQRNLLFGSHTIEKQRNPNSVSDTQSIDNAETVVGSIIGDGTCTVQKRNQTERLLGPDYRIKEEHIATMWDDYTKDSHTSFSKLRDYAQERIAYDSDYFIGQRIEPFLKYLADQSVSVQITGIELNYNVTGMEQNIVEALQVLQHELFEWKQYIDQMAKKMEEIYASVDEFIKVDYTELYDQHKHALEFIEILKSFTLPGMVNKLDLNSLSNMDRFPKVADIMSTMNLTLPELKLELDPDDIHNKFLGVTNACLQVMTEVKDSIQLQSLHSLRGTMQKFTQDLMVQLELKDYNPPTYQGSHHGIVDMNEEVDYHSKFGEETLNRTKQALLNFRVPKSNSTLDTISVGAIERPDINFDDYNFADDTSTQFEPLQAFIPDGLISFCECVRDVLVFLVVYAVVFDMFTMGIQWWRISSMYERGAIPDMPELDFRDNNDNDDDDDDEDNKYKFFLLIIKPLMNPVVVSILGAVFFIMFLVLFIWLPDVQNSCIRSTNGTIMANNMWVPMAINSAGTQGNIWYEKAEQTCSKSTKQQCRSIEVKYKERTQRDHAELVSYQSQHNESLEVLSLFMDCIETTAMTDMVTESCDGLKGYTNTTATITAAIDYNNSANNTNNATATTVAVAVLDFNHRSEEEEFVCPIDSSTTPPSAYRTFASYIDPSVSACFFDDEDGTSNNNIHNWSLLMDDDDDHDHDDDHDDDDTTDTTRHSSTRSYSYYNDDCKRLEQVCEHIPCTVNEEYLRTVTIDTDCRVNVWFIDFFQFLSWFLLHPIVWRWGGLLIYNGFRNSKLEDLIDFESKRCITVHAKMNIHGVLNHGNTAEERHSKYKTVIRASKRNARIEIYRGIIIFIVYGILIITIKCVR